MKTDYSNAHATAKVTLLQAFLGMQQTTAVVVKFAAARKDAHEPAVNDLTVEVIQEALQHFDGKHFVVVTCEPSPEGPAWSLVPRDDLNRPVYNRMPRKRIAKELRIPEANLRYAAIPFYAKARASAPQPEAAHV